MRDTYVNRRSQYNYLSSCFINGRLSIQIPADRHFIPAFFLVLSTFPTGIPKTNSKSCQLHFEQILWHFLLDATLDRTVRHGGTALDLYSESAQFSSRAWLHLYWLGILVGSSNFFQANTWTTIVYRQVHSLFISKPILQTGRYSASSFNFRYALVSSRPSSSRLSLLPRLPVSIIFFTNGFQRAVPTQAVINSISLPSSYFCSIPG
jgi:hypothetical protein